MPPSACPKALQAPHPSSKLLGKAISPPACEAAIPLYPLRYGIADSPYRTDIHQTLATPDYPALTGDKAYGLRVLRPGTYVYLCYFRDGRMWNRHYQVTEDIRFAPIWWGEADYAHSTPGSQVQPDTTGAAPCVWVPPAARDSQVYLLVSDTILTHEALWEVETNADGRRDALATVVAPFNGPEQPHVFNAVLLTLATPELMRPTLGGVPTYYRWSEITPAKHYPDVNDIVSRMHAVLRPHGDVVPLAVVLHDPVGIASELNYLCAAQVKKRDDYQAQSKHRLHSAGLIDAYFKHAEAASKTPPALTALARQRALVNLAGARDFPSTYQARVTAFQADITRACADVVAWLQGVHKAGLLGQAFGLFDLRCPHNASNFEAVVLHCLGAAVHSDDGLAELARHIEAAPHISPLWRALGAGDEPLMARLAAPMTIGKGVYDAVDRVLEERPGTPITDLLTRLLWPYLGSASVQAADIQVRRLRHIGEMRFGITVGRRLVTPQQYLAYSGELQGYVAMGREVQVRWPGAFLPAVGTGTGTATRVQAASVEIWEWETVGTTTVVDKTKAMDPEGNPLIRNLNRLRATAGAVATGVGGGLAIWGMRNAVAKLKQDASFASMASFLGASSALVAASMEAGVLALSTMATRRAEATAAETMLVSRAKLGATFFGTLAVALFTFADLIRAVNAELGANSEQARMHVYSAISGGALAIATGAGGTATAATALAQGGGAVAILGLTPAGWAVVAILALGASVYFTLKADEAQHDSMAIWLKHSAWGVATPRFTLREELDAWHSLHYSPRIVPTWSSIRGVAGTLRLRCILPITSGPGDFQSTLRVTLYGEPVMTIDAVMGGSSPGTRVNLYTHCVIGPLTDGQGLERGWRISMHKDAKVELRYLYRPDPEKLPSIGLEQPGAPEPLVFTSSGLFSDSIDPARLAPVKAPT